MLLLRLALCALLAPTCVGAPGPLNSASLVSPLAVPAEPQQLLLPLRQTSGASPAPGDQHSWAGISNYYLWSCNATVRTEALDAVRAAGLKVVRVFLVVTTHAIPAPNLVFGQRTFF